MFCNNCGAKIDNDSRFCASCGKQVVVPSAVGSSKNAGIKKGNWFVNFYKGRVGRKYWILGTIFWLFITAIVALGSVLIIDPSDNGGDTFVWFFFLMMIVLYYLVLSLSVRRFHDMNQTGWMVLTFLIPFVNLIMFVYMLVTEGSKEANKYGNPLPEKVRFFNVILNK